MFINYTVQYPNNFYYEYREEILKVGFTDEIHPQIRGQKFLDVSYAVNEGLDTDETIDNLKKLLEDIDDSRPDVELTHYPQSVESIFITL